MGLPIFRTHIPIISEIVWLHLARAIARKILRRRNAFLDFLRSSLYQFKNIKRFRFYRLWAKLSKSFRDTAFHSCCTPSGTFSLRYHSTQKALIFEARNTKWSIMERSSLLSSTAWKTVPLRTHCLLSIYYPEDHSSRFGMAFSSAPPVFCHWRGLT